MTKSLKQIELLLEQWHFSSTSSTLEEWMQQGAGWTPEQTKRWVETGGIPEDWNPTPPEGGYTKEDF